MKGLILQLKGEYASFRPYDTTSIIDTYFFPPKSSIIGMVGAALGLAEDELVGYYERIKVGIKIVQMPETFDDLTRIWKVSEATKDSKWIYLQENKAYTYDELRRKVAPVIREIYVVVKRFLHRPEFLIYLSSSDDELIGEIEKKIKDPVYPISLGDSDSLFCPSDMDFCTEVERVRPVKAKRFSCLIDKDVAYNEGLGIKIPQNSKTVLYPRQKSMVVSFEGGRAKPKIKEIICFVGEIETVKEISAYDFNGEAVFLF